MSDLSFMNKGVSTSPEYEKALFLKEMNRLTKEKSNVLDFNNELKEARQKDL
jgi:hypothetical protein